MRYLLDTNILLFYVRDNQTRQFIEDNYAPFSQKEDPVISIVSVAEILALAGDNNWGERKLKLVQKLIDRLVIVEIRYDELVRNYVHIERYNRSNHPTKKRTGSHIKMSKNDIWIAATAMLTKSILLTSDKDFEHLDKEFIDVMVIEPQP